MTKSALATIIVASSLLLFSFSTPELFEGTSNRLSSLENSNPNCPEDAVVSDYVVGSDVTVSVSNNIISAQSILEGSNVIYRSGSGTSLVFNSMTGSLSGPSPTFQIFKGSTLTVEISDCNSGTI